MPLLYCIDTKEILAENLVIARSFFSRTIGLLGKKDFPLNQALWIEPCGSIHTFFMAFPIDVLFLDGDYRILKVTYHLLPWRIHYAFQGRVAIEWKAGGLRQENIFPGMRVEWRNT